MINEQIRDKEIRLIGENGEQLGIMSAREAMKLAEKLAQRPKLALKAAKKSINNGKAQAEAIAAEADIWSSLFATHDQKEGMRAFVDKRKPQYIGK